MFKKLLEDDTYLYFRQYPPQTQRDLLPGQRSNFKKPKEAYRGVPPEQNSVYYYWWAFLRLNHDYWHCCEQGGAGRLATLYGDFGDVRDGDFIEWWKQRGAHCFAERQSGLVHLFRPPEDLRALEVLDQRSLILRIDVGGDLDRVLDKIRLALEPIFAEHYAQNRETLNYIPGPYQLPALHEIYEVARAIAVNPDLEGEALGAAINEARRQEHRPAKDFTLDNQPRLLRKKKKQAQSIVKHVVEGDFPVYGK